MDRRRADPKGNITRTVASLQHVRRADYEMADRHARGRTPAELEFIADREPAANTAKGSFKLDLIETVNADPMMQPSDLAVVASHLSQMDWPSQLSWQSSSSTRAHTGLSEKQVFLCRERIVARGYFEERERKGTSRLFKIVNPRLIEMRDHIQDATIFFREEMARRQANRRAASKPVTAAITETEEPLSHHPGGCDNSAEFTGNTPQSPQD